MDLLAVDAFPNSTIVQGLTIVNILALTFFSEYFAVCIIKVPNEDLLLSESIPVLIITVDSEFNATFQQGVDGACQAFIVSEKAFVLFLDLFVFVHDRSDQRSPGKKFIVVMDSTDRVKLEQLTDHPNILEVPEVLFVCPDEPNGSIEYHTTDISNNGSRSTWNVKIVPITPPDYFPDKFRDMQGYPIRVIACSYPPFVHYEQSVCFKSFQCEFFERYDIFNLRLPKRQMLATIPNI